MTGVLVGGYTDDMKGSARGVGRADRGSDGALSFAGLVAEAPSPSWLVREGAVIHAALEGASSIVSFALGDGGDLEQLSVVASGDGAAPCHLAVASDAVGNRRLLAARYVDGVIAVHSIDERGAVGSIVQELAGDGSGPLPAQAGPHAHHVLPLLDGRVLTADLGADRVHVHRWEGERLVRVSSFAAPPGTGPRDLLALGDGRILLLGEWSCELLFLRLVGDEIEVDARVPLLTGGGQSQGAGLQLSNDGRYALSALRGADRIAVVRLDGDGGTLLQGAPCGGQWPRHLLVDGDLVHVAHQRSNSIATFRLAEEGSLTPVGEPTEAPSPTCLLPLP